MALFIFGHIHRVYSEHSAISDIVYYTCCAVLAVYALSIVFGRMYLGMHSITDCTAGSALGAVIWLAYIKTWDALDHWLGSTLIGKKCSKL